MSKRSRLGYWQRTLWSLVYPLKLSRAEPTASGIILIVLSMGLGLAAYNSANNILFITVALLLASLLLSGLLSWLNMGKVEAELQGCSPCRVGECMLVQVKTFNRGKNFPSYGIWLDLRAEPEAASPVPPQRTPTGAPVSDRAPHVAPSQPASPQRSRSLRERLASMDARVFTAQIHLGRGIAALGSVRSSWEWVPPSRGAWLLQLGGLGSLFPFGFLRKQKAVGEERRVVVRPSRIRYEAVGFDLVPRPGSGGRRTRRGGGNDLLSLRHYAEGDSHRLIHWKASARQGHLLVRENAEEAGTPLLLSFDPDTRLWREPAQLELGISLAATLALDLFEAERLAGLHIQGHSWQRIRGAADLEAWLDVLSCLQAAVLPPSENHPPLGQLITFKPEGPNGAAAYADGRKIALA